MKRETLVGVHLVLMSLTGCGSLVGKKAPSDPVSQPAAASPDFNITSISPSSVPVGRADFTLTIRGTGFQPLQNHMQSIALWSAAGHDVQLLPTSVSASELTAIVPASLLTTPLTAQIAIENGDSMGITSGVTYPKTNSAAFTVSSTGDPNSPFTPVGGMSAARDFHTATLLRDGRVLVAGGAFATGDPDCETALKTAEIFDPRTLSFSPTADLGEVRYGHTATLIANGKVLIVGGGEDCTPGVASVELFDPSSGNFSPGGAMQYRRAFHTATQLQDGRVLVAGGWQKDGGPTAELYDPSTGQFGSPIQMTASRAEHAAVLLRDGRVLLTGGYYFSSELTSAEIYDPVTGSFHATGAMSLPRILHSATLLADGRVLIAGGSTGIGNDASAEIFDPTTEQFLPTGSMQVARFDHRATLLSDGRVLISGGNSGIGPLDSAELFDPATGQFSMLMKMSDFRDAGTATLLDGGRILLIGGGVASADIYQSY